MILGIYKKIDDARMARQNYLSSYHGGMKNDPWEKQAFHQVDLEKDVIILDNIPELDIASNAKEVMVINSYSEGFGQTVRKIHALCGSKEAAQKRVEEVRLGFTHDFPEGIKIETIEIGKVLSDDPELNKKPRI